MNTQEIPESSNELNSLPNTEIVNYINSLKEQRIKLTKMDNDPNPIPLGALGTIIEASRMPQGEYQVCVDWDNNRTLTLVCPEDEFDFVN
jgi:hypothetical protein